MFYGLDIDPFAVEIAKVTLLLAKQLAAIELLDLDNPLPLDDLSTNIVAGDALFTEWPDADAIVGNPPYLGRRQFIEHRGADYAAQLADRHPTVTGVSDYVVYWFQMAHDRLPDGGRAGLVATSSFRHGDSRTNSLDYVIDHGGTITDAWSSMPWTGDAAVHVSIVNWINGTSPETPVLRIGDDDQIRRIEPDVIAGLAHIVDLLCELPITAHVSTAIVHRGDQQATRVLLLREQLLESTAATTLKSRWVSIPPVTVIVLFSTMVIAIPFSSCDWVGTHLPERRHQLRKLFEQFSSHSRCPTGGCRSRTRPTSHFEDSRSVSRFASQTRSGTTPNLRNMLDGDRVPRTSGAPTNHHPCRIPDGC